MADEVTTNNTNTGTASTTTTTSTTNASDLSGYNENRINQINNMYDSSLASNKTQLEAAYNQNMSDWQNNYDKITPQYQESRNELSQEYERQRRNNNLQANANGLNTGAGSQMALAQSNAHQSGQASLQKAENEALDEANRQALDIKTQYQSDISQAVSDNDYQRAAALLDEYGDQYNRQMTQASTLAEYGDFSGYAAIYGQSAADNMAKTWALQNPLMAYNMGKLTADEYFNMTGSYPPGYAAATTAVDSGGGYGGNAASSAADYFSSAKQAVERVANSILSGYKTSSGSSGSTGSSAGSGLFGSATGGSSPVAIVSEAKSS